MTEHPRRSIYYWKCDRPAAFHGTAEHGARPDIEQQLHAELTARFSREALTLTSAGGQGNHITFRATLGKTDAFVRIEDGPEHDDYIEVESHLLGEVRTHGLPTPRVLAVDASRARVPFAWQVLENVPLPDLNAHFKNGTLDVAAVAHEIGAAVARWQAIQPDGFGPFDGETLRNSGRLTGFHAHYADYFHLHLERHLSFLTARGFLTADESMAIAGEIARHRSLLALEHGCLVHKDLALWNILGSERHIAAFIDFDDAISGDPMDDLSLLACFHDAAFLRSAFEGYQSICQLPPEHLRRFWLHLLRNMIVKAVIRVGAGYFERSDGFFLIGSGGSGADLKRTTHERIALALRGLAANADLSIL
ncbi:MAG: phosphotransferase family protein [Roseimicrobium sp.]